MSCMLSFFLHLRPSFFLLSFLFVGFLFFAHPASAATITWTGGGIDATCGGAAGDGNKWSCGANWSGGVAPGTADVATFDGAFAVTGNKDANITASIDVAGININGYTGIITQTNSAAVVALRTTGYTQASGTFTLASSGTPSMTNTGPWTHTAGGTFNGGTATVTFSGTATRIYDVATTETFYNLVFSITDTVTNTITAGDTFLATNAVTFTNGALSGGTVEADGTVTVGAAWDTGASTTTLLFGGGSDQTITASATVQMIVNVNKSAGTVTQLSNVTLNNTFAMNSASSWNMSSFSLSTTTFTMASSGTFTQGASTITASTFSQSSGTFAGGSGAITLSSTYTLSGGTFTSTSDTLTVTNLTHTAGGTFAHNNGTFKFVGGNTTINVTTSETFYNLTFDVPSLSTKTLSAGDTLIVINTLALDNGALSGETVQVGRTGQADTTAVSIGSSWDTGASTTTLLFAGSGNQTITGTTTLQLKVNVNKTGGTVTQLSNVTLNNTFDLNGGSWNMSTFSLNTTTFAIASSGTFTQGESSLTTTTFAQSSGTFSGGSGSVSSSTGTISSTAIYNASSGTTSFSGAFSQTGGTFSGGSGTSDFNNTWSLSGGTFTTTSGTTTIASTFTHTAGGTFTASSGLVTFDGGSITIDVSTSETFYNLTFGATGGTTKTIANSDSFIVTNTLTLTDGLVSQTTKPATGTLDARGNVTVGTLFDGGTGTLYFSGTATQAFDLTGITGGFNADITVNKAAGEVDLLSALVMDASGQDLTIQEGTFDLSGFALTVTGAGTETITVESGGNLQLQGGETITADSATYPDLQSGSTVTYDGTSSAYTIANFTDNYHHLVIAGAASSVFSMGATETLDGNLTITTGIFSLAGNGLTVTGTYSNNDTFRLRGSETVSLTMDTDSGLTQYVGDGDSAADTFTLKDFGSTDYYNLSIPSVDTADIYQSAGAKVIAGTFTISLGAYDANGQTTTSTGLVTVSGGTYTASTATQTFNAGLTVSGGTYTGSSGTADVNGTFTLSSGVFTAPTSLTVSASFTHSSGTFTHNSGTVTLDGTSQTISGATTFNNFTKTVSSAATLTFPASVTQTFVGTLTLQGASGQRLSLRSSITDTQASIDPQGSRSVQYLDVKDNLNANVTAVSCSTDCVSSGNNTNWTIGTPGITVSAISGNTTEAAVTATFTIVLDTQPSADVTIGLSSSDTTEGTIAVSSVVFTNGNWSTPQTVTVTGVNDDLDDGDIAYSIVTAAATSPDGDYNTLNASNVSVTNTDNDTSGFTVGTISGNTTEGLVTATFTIVLTAQPTADVSLGISSNDTTEGTIAVSTLTFTSGNWSSAQTVTVTGVNDDVDDGDIAYSIVTAAATSVDSNYNTLNASDVSVTNTDNDTAGVTVSAIFGNTTEAGATATFTVVLNTQPTGNVEVDSAESDATEGSVTGGSILTFTTVNWATPQTVTVTGQDDDVDDGNIAYTILVTIDAIDTADAVYDAINPSDVSVANTDNDTAAFVVAESSGTTRINEGSTGNTDTFTVVLASQPTSNVVFSVTSSDTTSATVDSATLTFTSGNWSTPQTVTVSSVSDANSTSETPIITISIVDASSDDTFDALSDQTVSVAVTDDDGGRRDDDPVPPLVYLLSPVSSATYDVGEVVSFYWDASTSIENLALQARVHRTTSWRTLFETEELTGTYDWTVPARYEDTVLDVRIIGYAIADGSSVKDSQDSLLRINAEADDTAEETDDEEDIDDETDTDIEDELGTCAFETGSYIKLDWLSTVYYVDEGCARRPFVNGTAYFTYEDNWSPVEVVTVEDFSTSHLGLLMPPKPETVLVKIESTPEVYAVETSDDDSTIATLRWVPTEEIAQTLFGTDWDLSVIDVSSAFFIRFGFGSSLTTTYTGNTDLYTREDLANR